MPGTPDTGSWDIAAFNQRVIDEFRANGGTVTSLPRRTALILLTTTGANTRERRTVPLAYERFDDRSYVVGAVLGSPRHPGWYHNILADPHVTVEVGADRFDTTARVLEGSERDRIWSRLVQANPGFGEFQARTSRIFPIIELANPAHNETAS